MSIKNGDMPAMPMVALDSKDNTVEVTTFGLAKREQFAAMAMQGLKAGDYHTFSDMASDAVMIADALLAQLEEKGDVE